MYCVGVLFSPGPQCARVQTALVRSFGLGEIVPGAIAHIVSQIF